MLSIPYDFKVARSVLLLFCDNFFGAIMKNNKFKQFLILAGVISATLSGGANAAFALLPTPENNAYATYGTYQDALGVSRDAIMMNGIPIALKYDDFWSYSAQVLSAIQSDTNPTNFLPSATFGTYNFSVGTGTIAVNMTSNSGGATNINPNGSGVNFQDPVNLSSNNTVNGWTAVWGGKTQSYTDNPLTNKSYSDPASAQGGTSTVGNMLTYLHSINSLWSVPVFYADYNQTGSMDSLWFSAKFEVWDSTGTVLKQSWQLDRTANNTWDESAPTFNYGLINFYGTAAACASAGAWNPITNPNGCAGVTANGDEYLKIDHNKGSGHPDFLVYSPDMDLNAFDANDLIVVTMNLGCIANKVGALDGDTLGCNTNGGEEFGIVGGLGAPVRVPEPGMLGLLGLGLGLLGWTARRQRV